MKILVISDTHKNINMLRKAIDDNPDIKVIFHLGDHVSDVEEVKGDYPDRTFYCVAGNNDFFSDYPLYGIQVINGRTIYYTHGHLQRVHDHPYNLIDEAKRHKADIVLFGHTHIPCQVNVGGMIIYNPGSASRPRMGNKGYGIIELGDELVFESKSL